MAGFGICRLAVWGGGGMIVLAWGGKGEHDGRGWRWKRSWHTWRLRRPWSIWRLRRRWRQRQA
jgi:hypothetical protein